MREAHLVASASVMESRDVNCHGRTESMTARHVPWVVRTSRAKRYEILGAPLTVDRHLKREGAKLWHIIKSIPTKDVGRLVTILVDHYGCMTKQSMNITLLKPVRLQGKSFSSASDASQSQPLRCDLPCPHAMPPKVESLKMCELKLKGQRAS